MERPLILITDGGPSRLDRSLTARVESALGAAARYIFAIILREQVVGGRAAPADDSEVIDLLSLLLPRCRSEGVKLLVHGRADLAEKAGVDGVHLGRRSQRLVSARKRLGEQACLGYSAHEGDDLNLLHEAGASYCFYSPVFNPLSKPAERPPVGLAGLRKAVVSSQLPVYALGGISIDNIAGCRKAGAAGVAVITSGLAAKEPGRSTLDLALAWGRCMTEH